MQGMYTHKGVATKRKGRTHYWRLHEIIASGLL